MYGLVGQWWGMRDVWWVNSSYVGSRMKRISDKSVGRVSHPTKWRASPNVLSHWFKVFGSFGPVRLRWRTNPTLVRNDDWELGVCSLWNISQWTENKKQEEEKYGITTSLAYCSKLVIIFIIISFSFGSEMAIKRDKAINVLSFIFFSPKFL